MGNYEMQETDYINYSRTLDVRDVQYSSTICHPSIRQVFSKTTVDVKRTDAVALKYKR